MKKTISIALVSLLLVGASSAMAAGSKSITAKINFYGSCGTDTCSLWFNGGQLLPAPGGNTTITAPKDELSHAGNFTVDYGSMGNLEATCTTTSKSGTIQDLANITFNVTPINQEGDGLTCKVAESS